MKIAAYLDEAGEDPVIGCKTLKEIGIHYVALRSAWASHICALTDSGHQQLSKILHDFTVIMVSADPTGSINHAINICKYYNAKYLRVFIDDLKDIESLGQIEQKCIDSSIVPLLEITYTYNSTEIAQILSKHKNVRLLYDPVSIIIRNKINPFIQYWTLLKNKVDAIDVRDLKVGRGPKPIGFGDASIGLTIKDAMNTNFSGWYILEPSLGRKCGDLKTKSDVFKHAYECFDNVVTSSEKI